MSDSEGRREDALRLTGSAGANALMEAELLRLVKRSPFRVRVPKPRRDGDATLLYPFDPAVAWVAAVYHRTSSRVAWDLWSSPADRLEPLFADLVPLIADDDRLDAAAPVGLSVEVKAADDFRAGPLQLRGTVKNAVVEGLRRRGIACDLDPETPDLTLVVRRGGKPEARRTVVALDLGGGPRHRRGERVAMSAAPMRETLAAQLVLMSRWDARTQVLVDPMAGGGTIAIEADHLARGRAVRRPADLPLSDLAAFAGMPDEAPDLYAGTVPRILSTDADASSIALVVGNLRAAGLAGPEHEKSIVIGTADVADLAPESVARAFPGRDLSTGVIVTNPPYGRRIAPEGGEEALLGLYRDMGRAFSRFRGWRASVFVAHPGFVDAFGRTPAIVKPASNAALRGWFLVYEL